MPFNLGGPELIIVLVIVLIVFGAGKLPNVMRDFGRGVKEFKKAQDSEEDVPVTRETTSTTTTVNSAPPPTTVTTTSNGSTADTKVRSSEPAPRA
ncbi:MAG TPA: twin-arginine translocase TatA/TatE family subunit [Chloroflexota bacterium]|nr:twin-arginine translocase TatA/TatE family subunit [Chloroflexota bacterium]